jgi:GT2 family glycosyltransferase
MLFPNHPDETGENISIVVLTYNRKRLLRDCLNSLLAQTYPRERLGIIVVDDGSADGTREMVDFLRSRHSHVKYVYQDHKGIPAARNNGIKNATGDIIAIVADDYILEANYAETVVTFFRDNPAAMVVRFKLVASRSDFGSRISHFYFDVSVRRRLCDASDQVAQSWREQLTKALQKIPPLDEKITTQHGLEAAGAAAFRREVFARVGFFDESLQRAEDTDMTKRLRALGILIYYFPHHRIEHQYSPFLLDTLSKCFHTGYNRYKYYGKHKLLTGGRGGAVKPIILMKLGFILDALWRARQAESTRNFLFYLPFMFLFESANKLGFLLSLLFSIGSRLVRVMIIGRRKDQK